MKRSPLASLRRKGRRFFQTALARMPASWRSRLYRNAINLAPVFPTLELKIADTETELEACFGLLHDAYVASGFMRPHPSGLRVTPYHALPTTTTLCAKVDGMVVGTLSIVRDGVFGFPMQSAFDVSSVRAKGGRIAEISALAVHPRFRKTGGTILFPLMKFMYEYCTKYFDTRHLLIAVHPTHIGMYESLLCFRRLTAQPVDRYDFVNGAPAVGATLDLQEAPGLFERLYRGRSGSRNLHRYFVDTTLREIRFPPRDWHVSNDPVLTPALMHHFFNLRTDTFAQLDDRKRRLLHSIYPDTAWARCLPQLHDDGNAAAKLRGCPRFSLRCAASVAGVGQKTEAAATILEISGSGFQARSSRALALGMRCDVVAQLGPTHSSSVQAEVVRRIGPVGADLYGFKVHRSDEEWANCVRWLERQANTDPAAGETAPVGAWGRGQDDEGDAADRRGTAATTLAETIA